MINQDFIQMTIQNIFSFFTFSSAIHELFFSFDSTSVFYILCDPIYFSLILSSNSVPKSLPLPPPVVFKSTWNSKESILKYYSKIVTSILTTIDFVWTEGKIGFATYQNINYMSARHVISNHLFIIYDSL